MSTVVKIALGIILAVVLVVVAITVLLGGAMAVKGKGLVDSARIRNEVAKLNELEAAAYIYWADNNAMPEAMPDGFIPKETFIEAELLIDTDLGIKLGENDGDEWALFRCELEGANFSANPQGKNICATVVRDNKVTPISNLLICNIEVMKDDEVNSTGEGRGWEQAFDDFPRENYRGDCESLKGASLYAFRVFAE
jgi:hypothetical protein